MFLAGYLTKWRAFYPLFNSLFSSFLPKYRLGMVRNPQNGASMTRKLQFGIIPHPLSRQGQNVGRKRNHTVSHRPVKDGM